VFEAPTKDLQTHFVRRVGTNVNLGNVAADDVIGLETLRLGLRADTVGAVG
jgi:phosphosulfolactate synthase